MVRLKGEKSNCHFPIHERDAGDAVPLHRVELIPVMTTKINKSLQDISYLRDAFLHLSEYK
jgi:hypothetical protein